VAHSLPRPSAPPESESLPVEDDAATAPFTTPTERAVEPVPDAGPFTGHYYEWRRKRLHAIVRRYGPAWFVGARVLELGCGHGDIGAMLLTLGADVTFSEGRREHLDVIAERYPGIPANRLVAYDAEHAWPFEERFDLVINMGLVYHVDNWQRSIIGSLRSADHVVLETEVCDSYDPALVVKTVEDGPDQAISGVGSRPSAPAVEAVLRAEGFRFERISDNRCNAGFHRYDWPVTGTGAWEHGLRRFWFAWRR
jgi:SAM-dependent methyltransferase